MTAAHWRFIHLYADQAARLPQVQEVAVVETDGDVELLTVISAPPFDSACWIPIYEAEGQAIAVCLAKDGCCPSLHLRRVNPAEYDTSVADALPADRHLVFQRRAA